jgi:CheY-like chemotaxis protein
MRFFFDYIAAGQALFDHHGSEFRRSEDAFGFAEATALDLQNSLSSEWIGWSVEVRNAENTKFFSLPVHAGLRVTRNANAASDQPSRNPSCLLIIEDAPVHSAVISHIAGKVGFNVAKAYSYEDACKQLDVGRFDFITLDLGLGEHAGFEVLRYLSGIGCRAGIIVISQSDKETCDDIVELGRALGLNTSESLQKPIDLEALRATLAKSVPQEVNSSRGLTSHPASEGTR